MALEVAASWICSLKPSAETPRATAATAPLKMAPHSERGELVDVACPSRVGPCGSIVSFAS